MISKVDPNLAPTSPPTFTTERLYFTVLVAANSHESMSQVPLVKRAAARGGHTTPVFFLCTCQTIL